MNPDISSLVESRSGAVVDLLSNLISFHSTVGSEQEVQKYLAGYLCEAGFDAKLVPIYPNIEADEDYTTVPGHRGYGDRANLVFTIPGTGGGKSIILNSHVDVVPGPDELFQPRIENGVIYGRGACDAKGQVATIILALLALKDAGIRLKGDVTAQFVIEEEAGGNGALSVIMDGMRADGVLVAEASDFRVFPANRGAVWFKLDVEGKSTHMGRWREGVCAVDEMIDILRILKDYEKRLVAESGGDPLFPDAGANVRVNVGTINGGDWPSMVPGHCTVEGGVGFLPNKRLADIRAEVRREIEEHAGAWARGHYTVEFSRLHNEAYRMPPEHPLSQTLYQSAVEMGVPTEITGFTASCDARLFWHRGGMPTVVFGPGSVGHAHALHEQLAIADMNKAAAILATFLCKWSGT